jgi:hypothetical protein
MNTPRILTRPVGCACFVALGLLPCWLGCRPSQISITPAGTVQVDSIEVDVVEVTPQATYVDVTEIPDQLAAAFPAETPSPVTATPATGTPAAASSPADAPQKPLNITFDKIKFEMEKNADFKRSLITPEIEKLNGRNIRLRGFVLPTSVFSQTGIRFFVLVRDNRECCFGPGAMLYDCVMVYMNPGKTTDFVNGVITVEGKFSIEVDNGPDGKAQAIYRIDADSAK